MLADGQFHSGDQLGELLGMSRAAVWKRVQKLQELGLVVESVRGRGYRIEGGLNLLQRDRIQQGLSPAVRALVSELDLVGVTTSTNKRALEKAASRTIGYVCAAEQQTAGRGRRGRAWVSPYAANLYMSAVWEFAGGVGALEGLSLAVGIAVARALSEEGVQGVRLKWPNDLLHNDRKLGGILIEMVGDAAGPCQVVVGIGINVSMPSAQAAAIDQPWTDIVSATGRRHNRNQLLCAVLNELMPLLSHFEQQGFAHYQALWGELDAFIDRPVTVQIGESVEIGTARGVDASGAIIVDTPGGRRHFSGGEISLRRVE